MVKINYNDFWQAFIISLFIFGLGILIGVLFENWRESEINSLYEQSDAWLVDIKAQTAIYESGNFNCELAMQENFKFADKIYEEGLKLDQYEESRKLTLALKTQHMKYDALRVLLFLNSLEIKEKCNLTYHNVVYFYKYDNPRLDLNAKQRLFSELLGQLKDKQGDKILLIPMAADVDISSVNILLDKYEIDLDSLPVILIDEKIKVNDFKNLEELESYFK